MDNEFDFHSDEGFSLTLVKKFEEMLFHKEILFFDVEEFEDLLDYYNSKNNFTRALEVVKHALLQHPKSGSLLLSCAQVYVAIHKPQEALRYLQMAENVEPFNRDLFYTKASIFSQLRKSEKAIDNYKKALDYADEFEKEDILLQLAFEYENTNDYENALVNLKQVLELNPENETALYEVGFCYDFSGKIEEGKTYFSEFVDRYPYSYIAWYNLGITFSKLELYEKAISCFDFAIAINEDFPTSYFNKAHALSQLEKYQDAIECYEETLKFEENDALSYYYIGENLEKLENYTKAIYYYKVAIDLDEFLSDAWLGVASCLFELNQDLDSLHYVQKALDCDELNSDAYYMLGDVNCALGLYENALTAYEKVLELEEDHPDILIDLGITCSNLERYDTAMEYFVHGVKTQPKNGKLIYNFVAFLLKREDLINALFYLDIALKDHYDQHTELFEVYPDAIYHPQVVELLEYYKK